MLQERFDALGRSGEFLCPQLPVSPAAAARELTELIAPLDAGRLCLVGSSLGGYYATWLAERSGCRALLLNPAVNPQRDLAGHLGVQNVYHSDETIQVEPHFLDELAGLRVDALTRLERYFLICAKGDELLDWREMSARYAGARQQILEGSDHGLSNFADVIDSVLDYAA